MLENLDPRRLLWALDGSNSAQLNSKNNHIDVLLRHKVLRIKVTTTTQITKTKTQSRTRLILRLGFVCSLECLYVHYYYVLDLSLFIYSRSSNSIHWRDYGLNFPARSGGLNRLTWTSTLTIVISFSFFSRPQLHLVFSGLGCEGPR